MPQIKTTFCFHSTAEETMNGIDLSESRIIVTGGSSGIGIETARTLALTGAEVTLAVRNVEAGNIVAANIKETTSNPKVAVAHLDLADLASVREFVGSWRGSVKYFV
jgi:NAD(P)-dependent dehydrogenase (short-subunit alcohol dehydrogenase family)